MWKYNPDRLRILQVSTTDRGGGAESSALNLWKRYKELGHQSWLAVGNITQAHQGPEVINIDHSQLRSPWAQIFQSIIKPPESNSNILEVYFQKLLRFASEPARVLARQRGREDFDFPATRRLIEITPELPDVIHCHNLHGGYFDLRSLPALSHKRPLILNLHDAWLLSGHCAHSFYCERWKTGCGSCPNLGTYPAVPRDATAFNWRRKREIFASSRLYITTVSQWLMDKADASMLHGVKQRVIYNGIQTDLFTPGHQDEARRLLGLPEGARIVLFTAHNEFKDFNTMRAALERLQMEDRSELVFVCLGRSGVNQPLGQGVIHQIGREENPERMAAYYRAADVFIHAALEESFGNTITEALACGTPVVATAVGGIPEQVRHGNTGYLTPRGDPDSMCKAIATLLNDEAFREAMGRAGREDVAIRFSLERQASDFLNWYGEILQDWESSHAN